MRISKKISTPNGTCSGQSDDSSAVDHASANRQQSKATEVLRWLAVLPGGVLAGLLVLFPLHWVLYSTLVSGSMIQMPVEDMAPIERFLSPIFSSLFIVYAGALIAPRKQVLVSYVLFFGTLFVRMLPFALLLEGQHIDTSVYGILRMLLASLAGAVGVVLVTLRERQKDT